MMSITCQTLPVREVRLPNSAATTTLRVLSDRGAFAQISAQWNQLLAVKPGAAPFLTWEWLDGWLEEFRGPDQQIEILTAWSGDNLVAGFPLLRSRRVEHGLFKFWRLELIGTGEPEWEEVCSEYGDLITLSAHADEVSHLFAEYLQLLVWDELLMPKVLTESLFVTKLLPKLRRTVVQMRPAGSRYRVELPFEFSEYQQKLSGRMIRSFRRSQSFFRSSSIERVAAVDKGDIGVVLAELARLHSARWQSVGKPGAFQSPRFQRFHQKVAQRFLDAGWLRLRYITDQTKVVSVQYNIRYGDTEYYYQSGFDIKNYRKASLGTSDHLYAIEQAILEGLAFYDFMGGPDDSYKRDYRCQLTPMFNLRLIRLTIRGALLLVMSWTKSLLRGLLERKKRWIT